jgi:hypothetical protein
VAGTTHVLGSAGQAAKHEQFRREYLGPRGLTADRADVQRVATSSD